MAISIRSPLVERRARELARISGTTMTEAIESALAQRLVELDAEARSLRAELAAIGAECAAAPDLDTRSPEEILGYAEQGAF